MGTIIKKKGDTGLTSLICGARLSKDHPMIDALGELDEFMVCLGISKAAVKSSRIRRIIDMVQRDLIVMGAETAVSASRARRYLKVRIGRGHMERLDRLIGLSGRPVSLLKGFVIPGKNLPAAHLDLCRAVARRVERRIVGLTRRGFLKSGYIVPYLNRLSYLLYLLARESEEARDTVSRAIARRGASTPGKVLRDRLKVKKI